MLRRQAILLLASTAAGSLIPCAWAQTPDFAPGQMWSLKSYPAKVIVGRVEAWYDTTVVLVSVTDVPGGILKEISFLAIEKPALAASVDQLLASDAKPLQGFDAGYYNWKAQPGSGIFSATMPQTIDAILKNRNISAPPLNIEH
jgi:hypothetical protein